MATEEISNKKETREFNKNNRPSDRRPRDNRRSNNGPKEKLLDGQVVNIARVTKVTKGGRHMRFAATYAVGDKKGLIGLGTGKANEVQDAIKKAEQAAGRNLVKISLVDGRTISHDVTGKCGRAKVLLKKAKPGTGVIAGGTARIILELAGVKDVVSKSLGSNTKVNVAKATIDALKNERTREHIAELRGKKGEEL
ncbi:MAG TPA: 30S ribosomal protein S5 [Firmicutes bacterium]|nr:30S ribosomal protein S5 [Bacillota bacterium]